MRARVAWSPGIEIARKSMEGRFRGEAPLELSVVARISRCRFAYDATLKAWRKRIFALIREMPGVERLRQLDDGEQRGNPGVPGNLGNFIEAHSPILQWLRGRD
jgi:hypothetical protein